MEEPFRDFGYNRTHALKGCNDMEFADYILLLDADMKLEINIANIEEFKKSLTKDAYYVIQGSPNFYNQNVRIIRNNPECKYWGVTHEYVELPICATIDHIDRSILFINDIGDGGSKANKYHRDIELLKKGLETTHNNPRYLFYLANSYRDSKQYDLAIETYKKRIDVGGWIQETWHSYYSIGNCYMYLKQPANAVYYWLEAYHHMPRRIENLYKIVNHYRCEGKNDLAMIFYEIADKVRLQKNYTDALFLETDVYEYKLDYEFSIIGYYCNQTNDSMILSSMKILNNANVAEDLQKSVLKNYKFYVPSMNNLSVTCDFAAILNNNSPSVDISTEFINSTPSICMDNNNLYMCTRFVNYRIGANGQYTYNKHIITTNLITVFDVREPIWKKTDEFIVKYNEVHDSLYVGIEDIRLFVNDGILHFNGNRGVSYGHIAIETGTIDFVAQRANSKLATKQNIRRVEKNWVLFPNKNTLNVIYQWHPLIIGEYADCIEDNTSMALFVPKVNVQTPHFFKSMRGSTNGVVIGENIWFITHLVSDEDRRYYYHVFVLLDKTTYVLKKYSIPFTFEKKNIEFTLGFVYLEQQEQLLIGYSTNDSTSKYVAITKSAAESLFY
jgi:tetratricopeptide (TPR) repeat protein